MACLRSVKDRILGQGKGALTRTREAHGFMNEANRERMFTKVLSFIKRSLKLPDTVGAGAATKAN
jgi:hypothetical protein